MGIENLRPWRAVTGTMIFEVRDKGNGNKTDAFVRKLCEIIVSRDDVKILRPVKFMKIRLTGLDDRSLFRR